jgi:hypothetical protein
VGSNPTATANHQHKRQSPHFRVTGISTAGCICGGIYLGVGYKTTSRSREPPPAAGGADTDHSAVGQGPRILASSRGTGAGVPPEAVALTLREGVGTDGQDIIIRSSAFQRSGRSVSAPAARPV